jgi:hypothetical protein
VSLSLCALFGGSLGPSEGGAEFANNECDAMLVRYIPISDNRAPGPVRVRSRPLDPFYYLLQVMNGLPHLRSGIGTAVCGASTSRSGVAGQRWADFDSIGMLSADVPAVSKNRPLKGEIKGFKTSHFLEGKTAWWAP